MELQSKKRKRRRGMRLDDAAVAKLPFKREPYAIWDLTVENCGVRVSRASKTCVVSVRIGAKKKFLTIGTVGADGAYEYLRELAIKEIARLKRERLPKFRTAAGPTLRQSLEAYITGNPELRERTIKDSASQQIHYIGGGIQIFPSPKLAFSSRNARRRPWAIRFVTSNYLGAGSAAVTCKRVAPFASAGQ